MKKEILLAIMFILTVAGLQVLLVLNKRLYQVLSMVAIWSVALYVVYRLVLILIVVFHRPKS